MLFWRRLLPENKLVTKLLVSRLFLKLPRTTQTNQTKKITGVIKDQNGEPVIGANVSVKGTTIGTITDVDGNFTLEVPEDASIQVSYIGYVSQEIKAGNKTQLDILLKEDRKLWMKLLS